MTRIAKLQFEHFLSVLVVAHTPKHPEHLPITMNNLQGSIDLAKVADSMFVLGQSSIKKDVRYLKQVKSRTGAVEHGADNVAVYRFAKFDLGERMGRSGDTSRAKNFLGFDLIGLDTESEHLGVRPTEKATPAKRKPRRPDRRLTAYARALAGQGLSAAAIAERLGVGRSTAHRYMTKDAEGEEGAFICPT